MLMLGSWCGGKKPEFETFLEPLTRQLNELSDGFETGLQMGSRL